MIDRIGIQVFVAIMADKMKKQQEEARIEAAKQRQKPAEDKKPVTAATVEKRTTRKGGRQSAAGQTATETPKSEEPSTTKSKRGRPKKSPADGNISNYFKKADVKVNEDNPTVQEALEHAADEYEANPTALGEQDLVATQQPEFVTGGKMRRYQLEGLEWLKSLWMNGL